MGALVDLARAADPRRHRRRDVGRRAALLPAGEGGRRGPSLRRAASKRRGARRDPALAPGPVQRAAGVHGPGGAGLADGVQALLRADPDPRLRVRPARAAAPRGR